MIPAAIAKRPIHAGAILLGIMVMAVAILGSQMDVAVWSPVRSIALLAGVFLPMVKTGNQSVKSRYTKRKLWY